MKNPIVAIGKAIGRAFKAIAHTLFGKDAWSKLGGGAKAILKSELGKIALTVVTEIASAPDLTDGQRRNAAFRQIAVAAKLAKLETRDSLINLVLELAVQQVKGNF